MVYIISDTVVLTPEGQNILLNKRYEKVSSVNYWILNYIHEMGDSVDVLDIQSDLKMEDHDLQNKLKELEREELIMVS